MYFPYNLGNCSASIVLACRQHVKRLIRPPGHPGFPADFTETHGQHARAFPASLTGCVGAAPRTSSRYKLTRRLSPEHSRGLEPAGRASL